MDKYSRALNKGFRFIAGMFCILVGLALVGVGVWGSFTVSSAFSMILIIVVLGSGFIINAGIGLAFLGDEYKRSDYIHDGETMLEVVETPKLLKRRMWVTFLGSMAYLALTVFYIVRVIFFAKLGVIDGIYPLFARDVSNNKLHVRILIGKIHHIGNADIVHQNSSTKLVGKRKYLVGVLYNIVIMPSVKLYSKSFRRGHHYLVLFKKLW